MPVDSDLNNWNKENVVVNSSPLQPMQAPVSSFSNRNQVRYVLKPLGLKHSIDENNTSELEVSSEYDEENAEFGPSIHKKRSTMMNCIKFEQQSKNAKSLLKIGRQGAMKLESEMNKAQ
ncbi:hypothetical protein M3Y98_00193100 [Aphelenchoides besseyi]|nr:hypothetical protein M3Y98_00193100 [Aphelenchoides besseyi]KAI6200231.1 hypothetical protein M3Y96_00711000 [Aphelenchoides besseyi]